MRLVAKSFAKTGLKITGATRGFGTTLGFLPSLGRNDVTKRYLLEVDRHVEERYLHLNPDRAKAQSASAQPSAISAQFRVTIAGIMPHYTGRINSEFGALFLTTEKGPQTTDIERFRSIKVKESVFWGTVSF
jgi:hypothetical protein